MHKTILTILGAALIAGATVQVRRCRRAPSHKDGGSRAGSASNQFRNSNAAWPAQQEQPYWSRYSGGYSAPAGR